MAMWPFVEIRKGKGAWNDYVFNVLMFFFVVFGGIWALAHSIVYALAIIGVVIFAFAFLLL